MGRSRFTAGLNAVLLAVLVGLPMGFGAIAPVGADHSSGFYLASMRSIGQTEQFCVEDINTSLSYDYVFNEVRNTLLVENPDFNWDLKRSGSTDFRTVYTACRNLNGSTTPTRNEVEIEYYVEDTVITAPAACGGTSCAAPAGATWSGPYGRVEYQWYYVWLKGNLIGAGGDTQRHVVNHETGHVLGLADGDGSCPSSIMHPGYYGCPGGNPAWPTAGNHATVNRLIDGAP